MYIKQIIIQGFKSYKEQTVIEPFSPGTNVIVGRNGSGKSNFFAAIRFVLSDAYSQMSREERQALLHEGSGSAVMTAYVEVIFDNTGDRFHTGNKELSIKRTISLRKDEYSIDKKVVSAKTEVFNMLEMAGFSRSNPYYIVPQGRVTALTNMKEADRLKLLKEIAGTESYEARRTESRKIMHETINKRDKIDELLKDVNERLAELEEEKEELRGFQAKDRERRCLEYAYYHHHQTALTDALEEIEQARLGADGNSELQTKFTQGERTIEKIESKLEDLKQSIEMLTIDKQKLENDRRTTSKALAKVELKVKDLQLEQSTQAQNQKQHDTELKAIRAQIKEKEAELAKITPEYMKRKAKEDKVKMEYDEAEAIRQQLFDKQSRSSQFKNKAERDKFLRNQMNDIGNSLNSFKAVKMDLQEEVEATNSHIKTLETDIARLREDLENRGSRKMDLNQQYRAAMDKEDRLQDERTELRREADKLESKLSNARRQKERAEAKLSQAMDSQVSHALVEIGKMKQEGLKGAYGLLADLMEVDETYRIPVEQVAGNSLFHYVVDNKETGTEIFQHLDNNKRGGRITLMPLAQLRPKNVSMPKAKEAMPLISAVKYSSEFDKAFQQVFGKTMLCSTREVATIYSRSHNVDCVTMDGDTTSKRGAVSGGYTDPNASRLVALQEARKHREEYLELEKELKEIREKIEHKSQEIAAAAGEVRRFDQEMHRLEVEFRAMDTNYASKRNELASKKKHYTAISAKLEEVESEMHRQDSKLNSYRQELTTEFKKALTAQEEEQLQELGAKLVVLGKALADCTNKRVELEKVKQILENDLNNNLRPREDELNNQAFEMSSSAVPSSGTAMGSYDDAVKEQTKLKKRMAQLDAELAKVEGDVETTQGQVNELEKRLARKQDEQQELAREIEKIQKKLEKGLSKKAILAGKLAEFTKNIRDLGVLPEEAFEKYEHMAMNKIEPRLAKVNEALKKYKHVNKKAFEQYNSFTTQQEQLAKRRKELDSSQQSIEDLISHLDQKKDEAIERTFKQVSREFATIFERLVPAGHGRLVIQRRADRRQTNADESEDEQRRGGGAIENYTGVGISVSFNSKEFDEQQKIQQLSGGQKSLCALCLIFAIQQTESSPMVVFDEVDANLDAQYRTAVAGLLQSISAEAGTQFICTTFRPEIVLVADKCYGVTFINKTSSIDCVPAESALEFVEGQQKR